MQSMFLNRSRVFFVALSLAAAWGAVGCAEPSMEQPASSARRSNVATPFITLSPSTVEVAPGASVVLTARPRGGEAILFSVDWRIDEGAAGGTLETTGGRDATGAYGAKYTAPAAGTGPFHVRASIHEYPSAISVATIKIGAGR